MENAVDALKMVAAILIFVIAIASSFSLFGTAKTTADSIITMRDKQAYLESAELDGGILYTSSSAIRGDSTEITEESSIGGVTTKGDRIVELEDVISTIYRYSKEKYGVTIVERNGTVKARFDSNTEQIMSMWYSINHTKLSEPKGYLEQLEKNTKTDYADPNFEISTLEDLYEIRVQGANGIKCGAPWYGNEEEIQKRIACDLKGGTADHEKYIKNNQEYTGKGLIAILKNADRIIEVTNEIDNSIYLKQTDDDGNPIKDEHGNEIDSNLLQQYEMPTIEIVYIII